MQALPHFVPCHSQFLNRVDRSWAWHLEDASTPDFFTANYVTASRDFNPAGCAFKPEEKLKAICADTTDGSVFELTFSRDCKSFAIIGYETATADGSFGDPFVLRDTLTKLP